MSTEKRIGLALPRWRRSKEVNSRSNKDANGVTSKKNTITENNATKFGAIKVYAPVLGKRVDVKTFVVTNKTTAMDLIVMVLGGYSAICQDNDLFYLTVENKSNNKSSTDQTMGVTRLLSTDKVLDIQDKYPRGESRFCLKMKPEAGIITVRDKCIKPEIPSCSVFMMDSGTCRLLVQLMLDVYKVKTTPEDYVIFEIDSASQVSHECKLSNLPLTIQKQWLDPYECYFEIRPKTDDIPQSTMRRTHSLEEIGACKKLLNIREIRKSLLPKALDDKNLNHINSQDSSSTDKRNVVKRRINRKSNNDDVTTDVTNSKRVVSNENGAHDVTATKLRDSLNKLRGNKENSKPNGIANPKQNGCSPNPRTSTPDNDTSRETENHLTQNVSSSQDDIGKRRSRSLSRDKANETSVRLSTLFGLHTEERARRRRRYSSQDPTGPTLSVTSLDTSNVVTQNHQTRSTSLDNLSSWERRKIYDNNRKMAADDEKSSETSQTSSSSGMDQQTKMMDTHKQQAEKPTTSSVFGKTRSRRALPKIPKQGTNDDIEDRKKRISERALEKVTQMKTSTDLIKPVISNIGSTTFAPEFPIDGEQINIRSIEDSAMRPESVSSHASDAKGIDLYVREMVFQPVHPAGKVIPYAHAQCATSQQTLQRVINDLRDAATKSYDILCSSDLTVMQRNSTNEIVSSDSKFSKSPNHVGVETQIVNGVELPKPVAKTVHENNAMTNVADSSPLSLSEAVQHVDNKKLSLHRVLKSCDLHHVTLRPVSSSVTPGVTDALKLIESPFVDDQDRIRCTFKSPSGNKPLLGQNGSAFKPVSPPNSSSSGGTLGLLAVNSLDRVVLTEVEGTLREGDYLIELNGTSLLSTTLQDAVAMLTDSGSHLELVLARPKPSEANNQSSNSNHVDKCAPSLANEKADCDDIMEQVTRLNIELQSRDNEIHGLELDLAEFKQRLAELSNQSQYKEKRISDWKLETNTNNIEIARLKFESNQKDEKIAQLKNLLIHQNEVMNLPNNNVEYFDYDYEGTHVSAV